MPPTIHPPPRHALRARLTAASVLLAARWTPYVETELLGLRELVQPGGVCVDIGAAAGLYTLELSQLAGPSGQVHSVEPLSIARPVWTRLLGARSAANVHHHTVALAAEPGSGVMSVPIGRYGPVTGRSFVTSRAFGLGSNDEFRGEKRVDVKVSTLDSLCAGAGLQKLDFVKIDVEGAELHVLQGGQQVIDAFRPALLMEIEGRHTARYRYSPEDLRSWLTERGYEAHVWQRGWRQVDEIRPDFRNYLFRMPAPLAAAQPAAPAPPLQRQAGFQEGESLIEAGHHSGEVGARVPGGHRDADHGAGQG